MSSVFALRLVLGRLAVLAVSFLRSFSFAIGSGSRLRIVVRVRFSYVSELRKKSRKVRSWGAPPTAFRNLPKFTF